MHERVAQPNFLLCDYFNKQGRRIERLYLTTQEGSDATERVRETIRSQRLEPLLDAMMAEANNSGAVTDLSDAALALNALLHEVVDERLPMREACDIVTIRINFRKAVTIAETIPTLEAEFGGNAVSWARGIFRGLAPGPAGIH